MPARRQKRLFDDTREAEQVLHWLASLGPGTLCCNLLPTIIHASLCRLAEEKLLFDLPSPTSLPQPCHSSSLATILDVITQRAVRLSRQPPDTNKYETLLATVVLSPKLWPKEMQIFSPCLFKYSWTLSLMCSSILLFHLPNYTYTVIDLHKMSLRYVTHDIKKWEYFVSAH